MPALTSGGRFLERQRHLFNSRSTTWAVASKVLACLELSTDLHISVCPQVGSMRGRVVTSS